MENLDALNAFLGDENKPENKNAVNKPQPKPEAKLIKQKDGLFERVDKVYVTNDGRQLLREVY